MKLSNTKTTKLTKRRKLDKFHETDISCLASTKNFYENLSFLIEDDPLLYLILDFCFFEDFLK